MLDKTDHEEIELDVLEGFEGVLDVELSLKQHTQDISNVALSQAGSDWLGAHLVGDNTLVVGLETLDSLELVFIAEEAAGGWRVGEPPVGGDALSKRTIGPPDRFIRGGAWVREWRRQQQHVGLTTQKDQRPKSR